MARLQIKVAEVETPEELENITSRIRQAVVKLWLISQNRIGDLLVYGRTFDHRFEQEAEAAGYTVTFITEES